MTERIVMVTALALGACMPQMPADEGAYQDCMARVELDMHAKANRLCPPDVVYFDDCEHAPSLTEELEARQESCND